MKILNCFLLPNDSYMLSIIQSIKNVEYYEKINSIEVTTDDEYQDIISRKKELETAYHKFFNFEYDFANVINDVKISLNKVLELALFEENTTEDKKEVTLAEKRLLCILKSKYYFSLTADSLDKNTIKDRIDPVNNRMQLNFWNFYTGNDYQEAFDNDIRINYYNLRAQQYSDDIFQIEQKMKNESEKINENQTEIKSYIKSKENLNNKQKILEDDLKKG